MKDKIAGEGDKMRFEGKTPNEVAQMLVKDPSVRNGKLMGSYNQKVTLRYAETYFIDPFAPSYRTVFLLNWSADSIGEDDWVGLYSSITAADTDYITNAWQWAKNHTDLLTSVPLASGYQARYLVLSDKENKYVSVVRTDPFPPIRVCSA